MSEQIVRAFRWRTNAAMINEAVMPLGYATGRVLDATYGEKGGFWKLWRPDELTTNDLNADAAEHHHDFRLMPWGDREFETVVYDPPYKLNGTPSMGDMDNRFGTAEEHGKLNREGKLTMIAAGAVECWRVTSRRLLVKVMDQVEGGQMRWETDLVTDVLREAGARKLDRFDYLKTPMAQPPRKCKACRGEGPCDVAGCVDGKVPMAQQHAAANYSTLLVFVRDGRRS
jgi:hypothetical protein